MYSKATRDAVFTVFGDRGRGSGFLVDEAGLVLTNSLVISTSSHISVQLNKDIAVLYIAPEFAEGLPVLKIAERPVTDLAFEGEKVISIRVTLKPLRVGYQIAYETSCEAGREGQYCR